MTQAHKTPGNIVRVKEKCFKEPYYTPYYDEYKCHEFEVVSIHESDHISLRCISGLLDNTGKQRIITLHCDEIQTVHKKK